MYYFLDAEMIDDPEMIDNPEIINNPENADGNMEDFMNGKIKSLLRRKMHKIFTHMWFLYFAGLIQEEDYEEEIVGLDDL